MTFQALLATKTSEKVSTSVVKLHEQDLMPGDVVVAVDYSTVNYKDALAITGRADVIRQFPLDPRHRLRRHRGGVLVPRCRAPVVGLVILSGLTKEGDEYLGGQILDPDNGKVYRSKVRLTDNGKALSVRGYIGVPTLGRSQTWMRQE